MENPFTFENIVWSAKKCMNGVRWKDSVALWRKNFISNCIRLEKDIREGKYRMSPVTRFEITSPKRRIVSSMKFRDRVVHKIICHQGGLIKDLFRDAFYDNCACRIGKGTDFARKRLEEHMMHHFRKHGLAGYVLNLDIRKFFDSIPHDKLKYMLHKKVKNNDVIKLVEEVIDKSGSNGVGIDLGSEISQCLANSYLTPVDHFIKHVLKIKCYVRYADNMVLILPHEKTEAISVFNAIKAKLSTLGLDLNSKSVMQKFSCPIKFLGFNYWMNERGRIYRKLHAKKAKNALRHLHRAGKMLDAKKYSTMVENFHHYYHYSNVKNFRIERLYANSRKSIPAV